MLDGGAVATDALTYQWEPLIRLLTYDQLASLVEQHNAEYSTGLDAQPLSVNWQGYLAAESQGNFRVLTARRDGLLVGYLALNFFRPLRHSTSIFVKEEAIWVREWAVRGLIWRALWREALRALPRPCVVQASVQLRGDDQKLIGRSLGKRLASKVTFLIIGAVMKRLGFAPVEITFRQHLT